MTRGQGPRPDPGAAAGHHAAAEIGRLAGGESTRRPKVPGGGGDAAHARDAGRDLRIEVRSGSPVSVRVVGDLDLHTAPVLRDRIQELGPVDVLVECDELRFVDSTGVSLLVRMHHDLRVTRADPASPRCRGRAAPHPGDPGPDRDPRPRRRLTAPARTANELRASRLRGRASGLAAPGGDQERRRDVELAGFDRGEVRVDLLARDVTSGDQAIADLLNVRELQPA